MIDLLAGLPEPTPAAIRAAREAAGISQDQAAALVGLSGRGDWWRYESARRAIEPARWAVFLLAVGQHPTLRAIAAPASI